MYLLLTSSELEPSLNEVPSTSRSKSRQQRTRSFLRNNSLSPTNKTIAVLSGIKLNAGFDYIDGGEGTVGDGAADSAGSGAFEVILEVVDLFGAGGGEGLGGGEGGGGGGVEDGGEERHFVALGVGVVSVGRGVCLS